MKRFGEANLGLEGLYVDYHGLVGYFNTFPGFQSSEIIPAIDCLMIPK